MSQLPPEAKKVFEGAIFDVYQWQQQMYDGTYETFEMLTRPSAALVIPITEDGSIIMTEQEQPNKQRFITFAGGRIDKGETPEQAAHRELLEETGYQAQSLTLFETIQPVSKIDWTLYFFVAKGCKKVQDQKLDSGEKITVKTVTFDQLLDLVLEETFDETNITLRVLKAQLDPAKMAELKKLLSP